MWTGSGWYFDLIGGLFLPLKPLDTFVESCLQIPSPIIGWIRHLNISVCKYGSGLREDSSYQIPGTGGLGYELGKVVGSLRQS